MSLALATAGATPVRLALAAMGTRFELVLHGSDPVRLRAVGEAALDEIAGCHRRFTRFSADSLLSHIQREAAARPVPLDADTFALFADALDVHRLSDGAFDITVASLMDDGGAPLAGDRALTLDPEASTLRFAVPGIRLDLGAIAKGHALDLAARVLREHRTLVESALLHGGTSSVVALGSPPGSDAWPIAVAGPAGTVPAGAAPVRLRDAALSVSATRGGGRTQPHVLDPRTGRAMAVARAASVVGPSARLADAWATALVVLGRRPAGLGPEWTTRLYETDNA